MKPAAVFAGLALLLGAGATSAGPRTVSPDTCRAFETLVRLDPGESFTWAQPIRKEHRAATSVAIRFNLRRRPVLGNADALYLDAPGRTPIQ